jgi:hypothetical protein
MRLTYLKQKYGEAGVVTAQTWLDAFWHTLRLWAPAE